MSARRGRYGAGVLCGLVLTVLSAHTVHAADRRASEGRTEAPAPAPAAPVPTAPIPLLPPGAVSGLDVPGDRLPGGAVLWTTLAAPPAHTGGEATLAQGSPPDPRLRYYALDARGSVGVVFDATGQVIGRADYEPFGASISTSGTLPRQAVHGAGAR